jgi:hypothetical protein
MASYSSIFVMEFWNLLLCMELVVCVPAVVTIVISLPLNQVFEAIVPHLTIEDCFDFEFLFTINECWRWRRSTSAAWTRVAMDNFTIGKTGCSC